MSDIRKTGAQNYRQLQQENSMSYADRLNAINSEYSMYNPERNKTQLVQSPMLRSSLSQGNTENYFGSSMFDPDVAIGDEINHLQDLRAENQPLIAKTGAALAKFAAKTGTTFLDTFLNTFVGGTTGIAKGIENIMDDKEDTGFWSGFKEGLWNNQLNMAITELDEYLEKALPEYYSEADMNAPWYNHSGLYVFNSLLKNAGFTVGAAAAMLVTGGTGLPALMNKAFSFAGKATKFGDWATKFGMGLLSATGEASIEAANAYKEGMTQMTDNINYQRDAALAEAQQEYNRNLSLGINKEIADHIYLQKANQIESQARDLTVQADKEMREAASTTLMLNYPILTVSNMLQFGKLLTGGYKIQKSIADILKNTKRTIGGNVVDEETFAKEALKQSTNASIENNLKKAGVKDYIKGGVTAFFSEGSEEGSQKIASETPMLQAKAKLNRYNREVIDKYPGSLYAHQINPDASEDMVNFGSALGETLQKNFGSVDAPGWEEFMLGAVMGALGIPMLGKRKSGKWGLVWEGGAKEAAQEKNDEYNLTQGIVDTVNRRIYSKDFKDRLMRGVGSLSMEEYMNQSIEDENVLTFKNHETLQLVQDALFAQEYGQLDTLKSFFEGLSKGVSDEDVEAIKALSPEGTKGMTDNDIKRVWQGKAQRTLNKIDKILDISNKAKSGELGDFYSKLNTFAKNEYIAMASLRQNLEDRKGELENELSGITGTTEVDKMHTETLKRNIKEIDKFSANLDSLIKRTHDNPDFLNDRIAEIQSKAFAYNISKNAEMQKQQYQAAETVEDIATIYFAADESIREQVFQEAKKDATPETAALMSQFENFQGDIQAVTNYIENLVDAKQGISDDEKEALKDNYLSLLYDNVLPALSQSRRLADKGGLKAIIEDFMDMLQSRVNRAPTHDSLNKAKKEIDDTIKRKAQNYGMTIDLNNPQQLISGGTPQQQQEVMEDILEGMDLITQDKAITSLESQLQDWRDIHDKLDTLATIRKAGATVNPRAKKKAAPVAPPAPSSTTTGQAQGTATPQQQPSTPQQNQPYANLSKFNNLSLTNVGISMDKNLEDAINTLVNNATAGAEDNIILENAKAVLEILNNGAVITKPALAILDQLFGMLDTALFNNVLSWWNTTFGGRGTSTQGATTQPGTGVIKSSSEISLIGDQLGHDRKALEEQGIYRPYNSQRVKDFYAKFPEADVVRDNYLRAESTVYYIKDDTAPNGVIYLAVKSNTQGIPKNRFKTIPINGEEYIVFGSLGYYDTDPQEVKDDIEAQKKLIEEDIKSLGGTGYKVSKYTTKVKDITEGQIVREIDSSKPADTLKNVKDLLQSDKYNPQRLSISDLIWGIVFGVDGNLRYEVVSPLVPNNIDTRDVHTLEFPGQVYMYIPTQNYSNGKRTYIPVYISPVTWNEWGKQGILYTEILDAIKDAMAPGIDKDERIKRIATIRDYICATSNSYWSYNEENDEIFFSLNGITGSRIGIPAIRMNSIQSAEDVNSAVDAFIKFLEASNLRLNINRKTLTSKPEKYFDAGLILTDASVLGTKGARPLIYPIDSTTGEIIETRTQARKQVAPIEVTTIYVNNTFYTYSNNTGWLDHDGNKVTDAEQAVINIVTSNNTEEYEIEKGKYKVKYVLDKNTDKMFLLDSNGRYTILPEVQKKIVLKDYERQKSNTNTLDKRQQVLYEKNVKEYREFQNEDSKRKASEYSDALNNLEQLLSGMKKNLDTAGYNTFVEGLDAAIRNASEHQLKKLYEEGFAVYYDVAKDEVFVYDTRPPASQNDSLEAQILFEAANYVAAHPEAKVSDILHHVRSYSNEWATYMMNNSRVERTIATRYETPKIAATAIGTSEKNLETIVKSGNFGQLIRITYNSESNIDRFIDVLEEAGVDVSGLNSPEDIERFLDNNPKIKEKTLGISGQESFERLLETIKNCGI